MLVAYVLFSQPVSYVPLFHYNWEQDKIVSNFTNGSSSCWTQQMENSFSRDFSIFNLFQCELQLQLLIGRNFSSVEF